MATTPFSVPDDLSRFPVPGEIIIQLLTTLQEENALNGTDVDVSRLVVKEFFPGVLREVYAYQFFRTLEEGKPFSNIATWIPAITHSGSSPLMWQQKGGRPYSIKILAKMDITEQLCINLRNMYGESSMLPALEDLQTSSAGDLSPVEQLRQLQLSFILEMIQTQGVLPTMRTLSASIASPADDKVDRPHA